MERDDEINARDEEEENVAVLSCDALIFFLLFGSFLDHPFSSLLPLSFSLSLSAAFLRFMTSFGGILAEAERENIASVFFCSRCCTVCIESIR